MSAKAISARTTVIEPPAMNIPRQIILSGSFTRPVPVKAGDRVFADYGKSGSIDVDFV